MRYFALTDPLLSATVIINLKRLDIEPVSVPLSGSVDKPIAGHPDIQVFLHNRRAFVHPELCSDFIKTLEGYCEVVKASTVLTGTHPGDVAYNIAVTGGYAFHRKGATDPVIREYLIGEGISLIHVKQGYSKCSTLIVDDRSIITADRTIHNGAVSNGIDSLLITPGFINLPGYKYGFIGGASGRFEDRILFTGSINHHPDKDRIYAFIESRGLSITLLSQEPAYDAGSLLISSC